VVLLPISSRCALRDRLSTFAVDLRDLGLRQALIESDRKLSPLLASHFLAFFFIASLSSSCCVGMARTGLVQWLLRWPILFGVTLILTVELLFYLALRIGVHVYERFVNGLRSHRAVLRSPTYPPPLTASALCPPSAFLPPPSRPGPIA
jgi:hypothetical protein